MDGKKKKTKKVAAARKRKNSNSELQVKIKKEREELPNLKPRMRLEPRLIPSVPKQIKENQSVLLTDIEKHRRLVILLDKNEVNRYFQSYSLLKSPWRAKRVIKKETPVESGRPSKAANTGCSAQKGKRNLSLSFSDLKKEDNSVAQKKGNTVNKKQKLQCRGKWWWSDVELKNLALGLQSHGFADLDKVADVVKTKSVDNIALFLKPRKYEFHKDANYVPDLPRGQCYNRWSTTYPEHLKTWPNIRKWRRIAYEQVIPHVRKMDYSEPVIASLCKQFYEEEEKPSDPQVINVKLIYKYLMDSMAGKIPPQLPPKESALVLDMLREMRSLPIMYDFEDAKQFLNGFKSATQFRPFEVKDEFKKKINTGIKDDIYSPNTVPVPENVFLDLSRHKKLQQSFNPLVTPVWITQTAQTHVKDFSDENVYVD